MFREAADVRLAYMRRIAAAIEHVARIEAAAEDQPMWAVERERGGTHLDAGDMAILPVEWLDTLLQASRIDGYRSLHDSEPFHDLIREFDKIRDNNPEWEAFAATMPGLANALHALMVSL